MGVGLQPLEDRIVVKPSEGEEMTASGLVIPDTAEAQEGEVLAVEARPLRGRQPRASTSRSATRSSTQVRRHRGQAGRGRAADPLRPRVLAIVNK